MTKRRAHSATPRPPSRGAVAVGAALSVVAAGASALTQRDMSRVVEMFETYCLGPVVQDAAPDLSRFWAVDVINEGSGDDTLNLDDRVLISAYSRDGNTGCGVDTSVNTVPVEGADYDHFEAFLNDYADSLLAQGYTEDTSCGPIEGSWGRYFLRADHAAEGKYLTVLVSATRRFANGGLSLLEYTLPVRPACP